MRKPERLDRKSPSCSFTVSLLARVIPFHLLWWLLLRPHNLTLVVNHACRWSGVPIRGVDSWFYLVPDVSCSGRG